MSKKTIETKVKVEEMIRENSLDFATIIFESYDLLGYADEYTITVEPMENEKDKNNIYIRWEVYQDTGQAPILANSVAIQAKRLQDLNEREQKEYISQVIKRSVLFSILAAERMDFKHIETAMIVAGLHPRRSLLEGMILLECQAQIDMNVISIPEMIAVGMTYEQAKNKYQEIVEKTPTPDYIIGTVIPDIRTDVSVYMAGAFKKAEKENREYEEYQNSLDGR